MFHNSTRGAHKVGFWFWERSGWVRWHMRFIWTNFQAKRPVLDPFGTKFDLFGASHNFGWDGPDKPCAALYYSRRGFVRAKMATLGFDKPCCCLESCRRRFFSSENGHPGLDKGQTSSVAAIQLVAGAFLGCGYPCSRRYGTPPPRVRVILQPEP